MFVPSFGDSGLEIHGNMAAVWNVEGKPKQYISQGCVVGCFFVEFIVFFCSCCYCYFCCVCCFCCFVVLVVLVVLDVFVVLDVLVVPVYPVVVFVLVVVVVGYRLTHRPRRVVIFSCRILFRKLCKVWFSHGTVGWGGVGWGWSRSLALAHLHDATLEMGWGGAGIVKLLTESFPRIH